MFDGPDVGHRRPGPLQSETSRPVSRGPNRAAAQPSAQPPADGRQLAQVHSAALRPAADMARPADGSPRVIANFRPPKSRDEFCSYYLHFVSPRPFYKTFSFV